MADEWIELDTVEGRPVAELIKSFIEAYGIPIELSQESYGSTVNWTIAPFGVVRLLVPASRSDEAKDLLQEYYARQSRS